MLLSAPESATLGASGAVFGMVGALLAAVHKVGGNLQLLLLWLVISVVYGFTAEGISWQGHLGGFLAGAATGAALVYAPRERRAGVQWGAVAAVCAVAVVLVAVRALALA
jgi:membrane associated rhomboid family serine protease